MRESTCCQASTKVSNIHSAGSCGTWLWQARADDRRAAIFSQNDGGGKVGSAVGSVGANVLKGFEIVTPAVIQIGEIEDQPFGPRCELDAGANENRQRMALSALRSHGVCSGTVVIRVAV